MPKSNEADNNNITTHLGSRKVLILISVVSIVRSKKKEQNYELGLNLVVLKWISEVVLILDHVTIDIKNRKFRSFKAGLKSGVVLNPRWSLVGILLYLSLQSVVDHWFVVLH
jgi:hypothetical protein